MEIKPDSLHLETIISSILLKLSPNHIIIWKN